MSVIIFHSEAASTFYSGREAPNPMPLYALGVQGHSFAHGNCVPVGGSAQWFLTSVGIMVPDDTLALILPYQNPLYRALSMVNPMQIAHDSRQIMIGLMTAGGHTSLVNYGDVIGHVAFFKKA